MKYTHKIFIGIIFTVFLLMGLFKFVYEEQPKILPYFPVCGNVSLKEVKEAARNEEYLNQHKHNFYCNEEDNLWDVGFEEHGPEQYCFWVDVLKNETTGKITFDYKCGGVFIE